MKKSKKVTLIVLGGAFLLIAPLLIVVGWYMWGGDSPCEYHADDWAACEASYNFGCIGEGAEAARLHGFESAAEEGVVYLYTIY